MPNRTILVTGGMGYIGSHCSAKLVESGYNVIIYDNLCNSDKSVILNLNKITNKNIPFIEGDIRNKFLLRKTFGLYDFYCVIHFAGLKSIGDSVHKPIEYYENNVSGTLCLLQEMQRANVKKIVFSSSATVYGAPKSVPVREDFPRSAVNPYGNAKIIVEDILGDLYRADPGWAIVALRYFNPVGAHESGLIGENLSGTPNNLMPCITQTAIGTRDCLSIFGGDYNTPDGTGIRDYIHVMDLAEGHVAAMQRLDKVVEGVLTVNLGTGRGTSVLELVDAFRAVSGKTIPYKIVERRAGDVAEYWADPSLAYELFGWKAKRSLQEMCADSWAAAHSAANRSAK